MMLRIVEISSVFPEIMNTCYLSLRLHRSVSWLWGSLDPPLLLLLLPCRPELCFIQVYGRHFMHVCARLLRRDGFSFP